MRFHILGICGTFMGSMAQLAKSLGHEVSGSDSGVYPPMSDQLQQAGIELIEGFDPRSIPEDVDYVIIGNAMSRGNPSVEYILERGIPYLSGPEWLGRFVLQGRWVAAVAGTHGKTTTASMLAWILEDANMAPGYLIGGVPQNFTVSARLGDSPFFVIEADEYDTAFFDKRSKFVHYHPRTLILNNLEFDHADIFPDLAAIERQFHHLVRTVPGGGQIIAPASEEALQRVLQMGCWTPVRKFHQAQPSDTAVDDAAEDWCFQLLSDDGSHFAVRYQDGHQQWQQVIIQWALTGLHNVSNAIAAMMAARHMGVTPEIAAEALGLFKSVKRRMECLNGDAEIRVFDDFAHHPTAIKTTLEGARAKLKQINNQGRLLAILEPRSNTMKLGHHKQDLAAAAVAADETFWFQAAGLEWQVAEVADQCDHPAHSFDNMEQLVQKIAAVAQPGDWIITMSNGSFSGLPQRLAELFSGE